jgi:hypothetical protein
MINKKLLMDCISFEISRDVINEAMKRNGPFLVKGTLQRADAKNQNGRIYPKRILEREAQKYEEHFIRERRALGELDHPESSVVNLKNVSHTVTRMFWEGDDLMGEVEVLPTPSGNILKELFASGIRLGISSRGMGSVRKNVHESADEVQDDFELIAFDFVSNPSTKGAFLSPESDMSLNESIVIKNPEKNKWENVENIIRDILGEIK